MSYNLNNIQGYSSIELKANQTVEGFLSGLHRSPFHGFSVEFADYTAYNTGESTRFIDWKLFARTDKLFIKNYQQETNLRCMVILDTSASMCFPLNSNKNPYNQNKFSFSVYACACILSMLYRQRDAFGISFISDKIEYMSEIKSSYVHKRHIFGKMEQLMSSDTGAFNKNTDISPALHKISEALHKRSLVIIFTDLLSLSNDTEELIHSLEHLRHNNHEVLLFHVTDKLLEQHLKYKDRPYKFVDMETGDFVKLNPSQIRTEYSNITKQNTELIHNKCNNMRIDFVECDINKDFNQILLPYLYKRMRLH